MEMWRLTSLFTAANHNVAIKLPIASLHAASARNRWTIIGLKEVCLKLTTVFASDCRLLNQTVAGDVNAVGQSQTIWTQVTKEPGQDERAGC